MLDAAVCVFFRMKNKMMVFDSFLLAVTAGPDLNLRCQNLCFKVARFYLF